MTGEGEAEVAGEDEKNEKEKENGRRECERQLYGGGFLGHGDLSGDPYGVSSLRI